MKKAKIIQKISTFLLLVCLALVMTPMQFLHDAFAAHHTGKVKIEHQPNDTIAEDGTHCGCHSIEAISPFINDINVHTVSMLRMYQSINDYKVSFKKEHSFYALFRRGPPAAPLV